MSDDNISLHALPFSLSNSTTPSTSKPTSSSSRSSATSAFLRDAIIGFSDGLTVPFALCAALSTLDDSRVVISGGLAELFAGSLSMGIGAVLASLNEGTRFRVEEARERREIGVGGGGGGGHRDESGDREGKVEEVVGILGRYGVSREEAKGVVEALGRDEVTWVQFMMDFELQLTKPSTKKAPIEGLVMGISYFFGGLLPMIPYFALTHNVQLALYISTGITVVITLIFGWLKAQFIRAGYLDRFKSALWTLLLCGVATGVSYAIVWGIDHEWK